MIYSTRSQARPGTSRLFIGHRSRPAQNETRRQFSTLAIPHMKKLALAALFVVVVVAVVARVPRIKALVFGA
jgi:hypothetical protein